ncbi:hypothetical protein C7212DRAFT_363786 [Tuber magnatum]|uniref:tRNA nucleotidyltransferase/poly(A) polymerase RNA and SrmB- binding domain-containing protein n=1 Tax=Tuber magnatum TaxID=42249 RepID=A0A317SR07_9PEZI|nr:hypothetical protein C7212DRAFT_363786 [Tuber magnatum]
MKLPEIKSALKAKISRERVGTEIGKMFQGYNPHASLSLIHEVDLYKEVFAPPIQDLPVLPVQDMKIAADIMRHLLFGSASSHPRISKLLTTSSERYHAWLIAAMSPWKNQPLPLDHNDNTPTAAVAIKEALRCSNVESEIIAKVFANWNIIQNMVINFEDWSRGKIGVEMRALGADWKNQVGACLMFELIDLKKNASSDEVEERGVMDKYETFLKTIAEEGLEGAFHFKTAECGLIPGAWMKPMIEKSLQHQLENPHKGKDELLQWVRGNRQALLDELDPP